MTPVLLHMGSLHAIELVLFVALALGPFVGLGIVIVVARRRDAGAGRAPGSRRSPESSAVERVETT